jgi:hypothetical protein
VTAAEVANTLPQFREGGREGGWDEGGEGGMVKW